MLFLAEIPQVRSVLSYIVQWFWGLRPQAFVFAGTKCFPIGVKQNEKTSLMKLKKGINCKSEGGEILVGISYKGAQMELSN